MHVWNNYGRSADEKKKVQGIPSSRIKLKKEKTDSILEHNLDRAYRK